MSKQFIISAIIALSTFFACTQNLQAQTTKRDTAFQKHWEVGVDLLALFDKNKVPAGSLFFRKNYTQKNGMGKAWRFRVGMEVERRTYVDVVGIWEPDTINSIAPYLSFGHEWQSVKQNFRWFAGGDLSWSDNFGKSHLLISIADSSVGDEKLRDIKIGLSGFLGFQFALTKQISISLESNAGITFSHYRSSGNYRRFDAPMNSREYAVTVDNKLKIGINPIHIIQLSYKLNNFHHEIIRKI